MNQRKKILEARQAYKIYRGRPVIRNATLNMCAGECVLVTGGNGSGKTTLLHLLSGMTLPTTGTVQLDRRMTVQYVPVRCSLNAEVTVLQFLSLLTMVDGNSGRSAREICRGVFSRYRLSGIEDMPMGRLSDAMIRMLMFAQAVTRKCELLVLDEPFTGLDPGMRELVYEDMIRLKQQNTAVLFTSLPQDGREVKERRAALIDKVWRIEHGEIKEADYE